MLKPDGKSTVFESSTFPLVVVFFMPPDFENNSVPSYLTVTGNVPPAATKSTLNLLVVASGYMYNTISLKSKSSVVPRSSYAIVYAGVSSEGSTFFDLNPSQQSPLADMVTPGLVVFVVSRAFPSYIIL